MQTNEFSEILLSLEANTEIVFFRNYTKLADLAFLCWFVVKSKINSTKRLSPMGIEAATLGLRHLLCSHSHVFVLSNHSLHNFVTNIEFKSFSIN